MTQNPSTPSTYPPSYYADTAVGMQAHPQLTTETKCDVCIVGAGYTGLSAALHLAKKGYRVVVLESQRVGWGASGRNGGQLGSTHRKTQHELEHMLGKEAAQGMWELAKESIATVKDIIDTYKIECDLTPGIIHAAWKKGDIEELEEEFDSLTNRYGYDQLEMLDRSHMREQVDSTRYWAGLLDKGSAHLHPLNYALGLARAAQSHGAQIYENSAVTEITHTDPATVKTATGTVTASHVLLACNGYLGNLEKRVNGFIMPINNFIIATEPLGKEQARALIRDNVAIADTKFVIDYYHLSTDNRLLFGGGENYSHRFPKDIANFVRKPMLRVFPQLKDTKIDYAWGGTLALTLNRMPHFGHLKPNIVYAHGYSGQGINMATLGGKLAAEAISGTAERFDMMANVPIHKFPGGTLLRYPGMMAGMLFYALQDRLP
ncbi:MAG: FAD-binding oxidoreductase [Parvibaculaceae bacterium]|nr:FAD-binding oxidoreductase [Parvibaculaceae bacterium]